MHWHADNSTYGWLLQGYATADNITGPYTFINATAPFGNWSQDFGTFTDYKDGRSYALYSNGDRKEARDVYLSRYNTDVSELEDIVFRFNKYDLEAPTIIQTDGSYYALMSHKTGYRPNSEFDERKEEEIEVADHVCNKTSWLSVQTRLLDPGRSHSSSRQKIPAHSTRSLDSRCVSRERRKQLGCTWVIRYVFCCYWGCKLS